MCFGTDARPKPFRYVSCYMNGLQTKYGTQKWSENNGGNYHFWCVNASGEIIDPTPPGLPPDPRRIVDTPQYIPWSKADQAKQFEICFSKLSFYEGMSLKEIAEKFVRNPQKQKCFQNSWALSRQDGYDIRCGSFGWILDDLPNFKVIGLDYGW